MTSSDLDVQRVAFIFGKMKKEWHNPERNPFAMLHMAKEMALVLGLTEHDYMPVVDAVVRIKKEGDRYVDRRAAP